MKPRLIPISIAVAAALATSAVLAAPALASHTLARTIPTLPGTALPLPSAGGAGAAVPFTEYEAENAHTNGKTLAGNAFLSIAAEASGRKAVSLKAGQYVDFVLAKPANAVDLRYSIPDGPDASLSVSINGHASAPLTLTAAYSHFYGNYPFTKNVAEGGEHHYFDDVRTKFAGTLAAGTIVTVTATANGTVIDLADFENVGAPKAAPAGSLDVTTVGADATGTTDSSDAIQNAINTASAAHQTVWIPAGTFKVTRQLLVNNVTVLGAGPWYTVLSGAGVGIFGNGPTNPSPSTAVHLADFAIFGDTLIRNDSISDSGLGGAMGGGSTVDNLWIQHVKVGAWFDGPFDGLTLTDLRIQDTNADGINLHDGVSHVTVSNTFVRNTGDDGMAMWSDQNADNNNSFTHDTVSVPVLANGFAIYGGHDNSITNDIASDSVNQGGGVQVANRFGSIPLAGVTTVTGNLLVRDGQLIPNDPTEAPALWLWAGDEAMDGTINITDNTILASPFAAIGFYGDTITNVTVDHAAIIGAGTFALQLQAPGAATFSHVTATGLGAAGVYNCASGFVVTKGAGNLGWSTTKCGFPPAGQLTIAQALGIDYGFQALNSVTTKSIDITNAGPKSVSITSVQAPAGYTIPNTCATIAAGATCSLTATFTPTGSANYQGLVTIDSTSPAGPYLVGIKGIGFDPNGNLALGRTVTSSSEANWYYGAYRLVDGDQGSYYESLDGQGFPQTVTLDLGQAFSVDRIVLTLPPGWGTRVETLSIDADGSPLVASADYTLDPGVDNNTVTITFPAQSMQTITLNITNNTGWIAAQFSELEVFAH
jgi:hypothetical protein